MIRRLLPTAALLTAGLLLLLWGLLGLARIFRAERQEANSALAGRRQAIAQAAAETLIELAENDLNRAWARLRAARADPLKDARGLSYWAAGRLVFPHPPAAKGLVDGRAADLLVALVTADRKALADFVDSDTSPWNERLAWLESLDGALRAGDDSGIEKAVRGFLAHRQRYRLHAVRDLPATLALAVAVERRADPSSTFIRGLLLDGLDDGQGGRMTDLARDLLSQRHRLGPRDFEALSQQWLELAEAVALPSTEFAERLGDNTAAPEGLQAVLEVEGRSIEGAMLFRRQWLLSRADDNRASDTTGNPIEDELLSVEVNFEGLVDCTTTEMRNLGLLLDGDTLAASPARGLVERLEGDDGKDAIGLTVESSRWVTEAARIDQRYRLKLGMLVLSAALAMTLNLLALWFMARRHHFLALREGFVAAVSHELKTPLASIHLLAETLERRLAGLTEARDYPSRIVRQAESLSFLVDNVLSFNRLDKGRWQPRFETSSINDLLSWLHTEARRAQHPVTLEVRGDDELEVRADLELLRLLLANLLRNSCQYNERETIEIDVEATDANGGIRLLWRDNGWGLDRADQRRVFDEFYRAGRAGRRGVNGTGLGLTICQRIARLHRGDLKILDSSPAGTTFELTIPR